MKTLMNNNTNILSKQEPAGAAAQMAHLRREHARAQRHAYEQLLKIAGIETWLDAVQRQVVSDDVTSLVAFIAQALQFEIKTVAERVARLQARHGALLALYKECEAILQCMEADVKQERKRFDLAQYKVITAASSMLGIEVKTALELRTQFICLVRCYGHSQEIRELIHCLSVRILCAELRHLRRAEHH